MQQNYIDILFQLQCCIASLMYDFIKSDEAGSSCSDKDSDLINELVMYMRTLKRFDFDSSSNCLNLEQIKNIINKINKYCNMCCLETNKLKI